MIVLSADDRRIVMLGALSTVIAAIVIAAAARVLGVRLPRGA